MGPVRRVGKQEVLPVHYKWLNTAFRQVVGDLQPPVLQIPGQPRPLLPQVVQRLAKRGLRRRFLRLSPCQQRVKNGPGLFLPLFVPLFHCQAGEFLFQCEQGIAVPLPLQGRASRLFPFGQGLHRLVKFSPCVGPAAHHADTLRQAVVAGVAVRMEPAGKALQKHLRVLRLPVGTVLIQHNGMLRVPACPVQPHVALALGGFPRFPQYLQRCLVRVEHIPLYQTFMQLPVYRFQPILRCP